MCPAKGESATSRTDPTRLGEMNEIAGTDSTGQERRATHRSWLRITLLGVFIVATIVAAIVSVLNDELGAINLGRDALWWWPVAGAFLFLIPGVVVLLRSDWHPVGWLMVNLGFGFLFSFGSDNPPVADLSTVGLWWLWLTNTSVSAIFWTVWSALIFVFPDRLSSRRSWHRRVAWTVLGVDAVCILLAAFTTGLVHGRAPNPMPLSVVPTAIAEQAAFLPNLLLLVALVDFIVRYRQARDPARSQYRWVVWAFLYAAGALIVAIAVSSVTDNNAAPVWLLVVLGYLMVPVSFMVAILRYRLYEIDRIVSRGVTYGLVAVVVAVVYAVPVLLLPRLLGEPSDLVVAASTLAAAAVFNPARRRIQRWVERRFNRSKYDAEHEMERMTDRLRSEMRVSGIGAVVGDVIARTLQPASATIWIRGSE